MAQAAAQQRPGRGNIIMAVRELRGARGLRTAFGLRHAHGLWAACGLALALGFGGLAPPAQAQPATRADIAVLREDLRATQGGVRALQESVRELNTKVDTGFQISRIETRAAIDVAIANLEARMVLWFVGFNLALLALLPFYIALLRRLMPGLFAPVAPAAPPATPTPASGGAGTRPPRKASA